MNHPGWPSKSPRRIWPFRGRQITVRHARLALILLVSAVVLLAPTQRVSNPPQTGPPEDHGFVLTSISTLDEMPTTIPRAKPHSGPFWQRRFFESMHTPYGADLAPNHLARIWAAVEEIPRERPSREVNSWRFVSPSGMQYGAENAVCSGRVLDLDATTGSQLVVAASEGLWGYDLFFPYPLSPGVTSQWIGSFAIDPNNEDNIIVGTGEPFVYTGTGLWKTTDGGTTWSQITMSPPPLEFFRVRYGVDGALIHAVTRAVITVPKMVARRGSAPSTAA